MEDHMASSETTGTGSSSVTMATDSMGTPPALRLMCNRVKVLEQTAGSTIQSDSYLRSRVRELERSERSLLLQLYQLASASHLPRMQRSQRLDQRLHMLREEVRTMTQEKEQGERVWRERLQRCQRQLKAKEEEMSRQSQYFENFKAQLQHKLRLACDRERGLQNRIYTLEKQLLDMTVSAATGMATISAVKITAETVTHSVEQERLTSMRGEGEGEEEKKEERKKQWQPSVGTDREGGQEGDEGKKEKETERGRNKDTEKSSNEARLQGFILSLQEDLKVLLEREEDGMTERRGLMEQLQEAQESSHFLGCKVEEMKADVRQLNLSESSLMDEVEELREENHRLQQILREAANQKPSQSSTTPESECLSPGTNSLSCGPAVCPGPSNTQSYTDARGHSSVGSLKEVQSTLKGEIDPSNSYAVPHVHRQIAAESAQNSKEDHSSSAKSDPLSIFAHRGSKRNLSFKSLALTTEAIDEFKLGTWCSRGLLNLEESPSEESDALREAYKSLGLGEDLEALREQRDRLGSAMQQTQEQVKVVDPENTQLKLQLRKQAKELDAERGSSREKIGTPSNCERADHLQSSPTQDKTIPAHAQDDLVQALNQESWALADRIQELLAHIELREEEIKMEQTQLRDHISRLEEDRDRLEQENQEQVGLITELTRKTEDDLNTIMELQQKLEETREQNNLEECVDRLIESVLKGEEEPQLMSSQHPDDLITAPAPVFQYNNHHDQLQNSPQNSFHVSSLTDHVDHLTKTVQTLKTEQDELTGNINSLREQQGEVALSVQRQTEEKQQLTRTVWGLKEEKDRISQCLANLRQEREHLTRTVCGLKDERDHFIRSMSGLKEEKEQLIKSISGLEREKEALTESLSSGKGERNQIMQSLQSSKTESDRAVLNLKQERDELTISLKCQEQSSHTLQDDHDKIIKSVSSLREEKERTEHSISCLKQEEKQIMLVIQGLREERNSLQSGLPSQTQSEERIHRQHLLNANSAGTTKTTENLIGTGDYAAQRCSTNNYKGNSIQEQSDLMREIEALGAQLKRSQEELDKSHVETEKLQSELCQSEAGREEAERKAAQAAETVMILTDVARKMEETRRENESLNTQVKELQSKLTGLVQEKTDALSLKTQIEEQYNILTAQLKAKTVALEELNSKHIALQRGQGSKDDLCTVLVSLRTRYNDIRAKYDALLKKRSQRDLDIAPLKAKLSCLVVKCQERNHFLVQMMKAMRRQGCVDFTLTQQVEQLLSDAALQDYTAAFTQGSIVKTGDYDAGCTPRFISKFRDYTPGFIPDQTCPAILTPANKQQQNGFEPESGVKCRDLKSEEHISISTTQSSTNLQDCSSDVTPAATGTLKKNANSPVPTVPVQENASFKVTPVFPALKESLITNTAQLSPSASGPTQATSGPEESGFHHPDMKGKSSPDLTSSTGSSLGPTPPSSSTRVSPSRRLSSPEKIISLHEQLQKTLMNSYQAPVSRGREQEPRKRPSILAPADLNPASQTDNQGLSFNKPHTSSVPVTTASSQAKHAPAVTTKPTATNKSTTLFNAVASRSANVTFSPKIFNYHYFNADISETTMSALSSSSSCPFAAMAPNKSKSTSNSGTNLTISPKLTKKVTAIPNLSVSTPLTQGTTSFDSNVLTCSDTNPKTTASEMTVPGESSAPKFNIFNRAAPACDGLVFAASAHCAPERSNKSARKSTAALDRTKTARARPEAPAEVRSVEVIKAVGQSSLMIGWERPPLDELGCSNGTFVYGYRVIIDGDFHKSVMSSACTKCIVENVDLCVPVDISVQTLGSNGLSSSSVHTMYRTSVGTDQH
ncbi:plectin-like [Xiphias gladius]|uniref:plectin-like n=1 Tax=Xiphias gladius TaxID=8245 RepID=UPI001A9977F1|nr:plectin-like [Xiphias gladius]